MEHSKFLSPSSAPAILQCNDFEGDGGNSDTSLGSLMHDCCEDIAINGPKTNLKYEGLTYSDIKSCEVAVMVAKEKAKDYLGDEFSIEPEVSIPILDESGKQITFGTADFVAHNEDGVFLLDYKSGLNFDIESKDYYPQMCFYALGLMQKHRVPSVQCVIWYILPEKGKEYNITYNQAVAIVSATYKRKLSEKTPKLCDYCSWCKKVTSCEAVNKGLAKLNSLYENIEIHDDITRPETLTDPVKINDYLLFNDLVVKPYQKKLEVLSKKLRDRGILALSEGSLKNYELGSKKTQKLDMSSVEECDPLIHECIVDHIECSLTKVTDAYYERTCNSGNKITKKHAKLVVQENLRHNIFVNESLTLKKKKK